MNNIAVIDNKNMQLSNTDNKKNELISLIKEVYAKGATDEEVKFFAQVCISRNLDPIARQIYFTKIWNSQSQKNEFTPIVSIDGMRSQAEETGLYAGQTLPLFCGKDGIWKEVWSSLEPPFACKIGVFRKDFQQPLYAIAHYDMYVKKTKEGKVTAFWSNEKAPHMLAKCCESIALRKACPARLSGLYSREELDNVIDIEKPVTVQEQTRKLNPVPAFQQKKMNETVIEFEKIFDITNQFNVKKQDFIDAIDRNMIVFCDLELSNEEIFAFKNEVLNAFKDEYVKTMGSCNLDDFFAMKLLAKRIRLITAKFNSVQDKPYSEQDLIALRKKVWDKCIANPQANVQNIFIAESALLNSF